MIIRQRKALPWLLSSLIGMGLAGCTSAPQTKTAPQWLTQPPQNSQFVYGVGSAPVSENLPRAYQVAESNGNGQIAQQLQAVESALRNAKQALIHDHMDHCLDATDDHDREELKAISRYL